MVAGFNKIKRDLLIEVASLFFILVLYLGLFLFLKEGEGGIKKIVTKVSPPSMVGLVFLTRGKDAPSEVRFVENNHYIC